MGSVSRLIAKFEALSVGGAESGRQTGSSDHTVHGTASSPADMPQTVPEDPCSSYPHPYLGTMSTEGTRIGSQARPSDHTVQGTASSSADMPHPVSQDLILSLSPVTRKRGESSGATMFCGDEDIEKRVKKHPRSELKFEPKHKIFLSHSGKQKVFTTYLCEGLEKRGHEPFFDRRDSSLPKGKKFAELIIKAAKQCEMLVVVVSEDYLTSKWPMIELSAFVQARKQKSNLNARKPKILPLFYELSVDEVREKGNRQKWYEEWYKQFSRDDRIKLEEWKEAVEELPKFNGLLYNHGDLDDYRSAIVTSICSSIRPNAKWDVVHVQGQSNICEVVRTKINQGDVSKMNNAKVIGFHGVGGVGKTTMCKVLCNEFTGDFEGRVCHLEFKSKMTNLKEILRKALMSLANLSMHDIEGFDEDQCLAKLRNVIGKKKVFMAIDNVWDDEEKDSISKARKLMEGPFHEGSVVVVTSRSLGTLKSLILNANSCFEVPELGEVDAINLFKYHAFPQKKSLSKVESEYVLKFVKRCHFTKGNGQKHYHALALQALGLQVSALSLENPQNWEAKLQRVMAFDYNYGGNGVFGIMRIGFDELSEDHQKLFMDVADYWKIAGSHFRIKWFCSVHEKDEEELQVHLDILKRRGFLQHVELLSGEMEMHDLYVEFAKKEMSGSFNKLDVFENQKWMEMDVENPLMRRGRNWSKLTHLQVVSWDETKDLEILRDWDLQYFSRVEVLILFLYENHEFLRFGILNLEPMICLRSIFVSCCRRNFHEVKGMERMKQLYHFSWSLCGIRYFGVEDFENLTTMGQFPPSLKILEVDDRHTLICSSAVDRCIRLEDLTLRRILPTIINLSKFSSLKELIITQYNNDHKFFPEQFNQIRGLNHLVFLEKMELESCEVDGHSEVNLRNLTRLQELWIYNCRFQIRCLPVHIRCLRLSQGCDLNEDFVSILKTSALRDLEVLELVFQKYFKGSTDFKDVGRWPRLKKLKLLGCNISKLPDLRESTNLKTLVLHEKWWSYEDALSDYEFQLGEDEIAMLSRLPRLQPFCVGYTLNGSLEECNFIGPEDATLGPYFRCKYIVDFSRRVLIKQEVENYPYRALQRDLGDAPYNFYTFKQNWENAIEIKYIDY